MSRSPAEHLEVLRTARDTVSDALAEGLSTVKYVVGVGDTRREVEKTPTIELLEGIEKLIQMYEQRVAQSSGAGINLVQFGRRR